MIVFDIIGFTFAES